MQIRHCALVAYRKGQHPREKWRKSSCGPDDFDTPAHLLRVLLVDDQVHEHPRLHLRDEQRPTLARLSSSASDSTVGQQTESMAQQVVVFCQAAEPLTGCH
eukprot:1795801-Prymnesium_polylepis.1